jgi:hypothetical protein
MHLIKEFDYRPPPLRTLALFLLVCAGTALLGYFSIHAEGGSKVLGFQLTEEQTRWFFRASLLLFAPGLLLSGALVLLALFGKRHITVTPESIILPRSTWTGMSSKEIEIRFADVTNIVVTGAGSLKLLRIYHTGGVVGVPSNMLRERQAFEQLVAVLQTIWPSGEDHDVMSQHPR